MACKQGLSRPLLQRLQQNSPPHDTPPEVAQSPTTEDNSTEAEATPTDATQTKTTPLDEVSANTAGGVPLEQVLVPSTEATPSDQAKAEDSTAQNVDEGQL